MNLLSKLHNSLNWRKKSQDEKDGFFDLPEQEICLDPSHNFPGYLCIPPGKAYRHTCPSCGKVTIAKSPKIIC